MSIEVPLEVCLGIGFWNGVSTLKQYFVLPKNGQSITLSTRSWPLPFLGFWASAHLQVPPYPFPLMWLTTHSIIHDALPYQASFNQSPWVLSGVFGALLCSSIACNGGPGRSPVEATRKVKEFDTNTSPPWWLVVVGTPMTQQSR